jgi:hypothetical protein
VRIPFSVLPVPGETDARPLVELVFDGIAEAPITCLVDTGSLRTRLPHWVADVIGVSLAGAPRERIVVAGTVVECRQAHVSVAVGPHEVPASVWFCDGWDVPFGLLGQEDVLRAFRLELSSAQGWFELRPERA